MPRRYAARTDDNHGAIRAAFRALGAYVMDTSHVGGGFPDLVIGTRGRWLFVEVKDGAKSPSRRKLTADQLLMHAEVQRVGCQVHVVESEADVYALMGARVAA
jgi:hypothetical protein